MAAIPPFQISRLQGGPQALRDLKLMPVLPCPQDVVERFATLIIEAPSVDVTYKVVWTAGEPTSPEPLHSSLRSSSPQLSSSSPQSWTINRTAGQPLVPPPSHSTAIDWSEAGPPPFWPQGPTAGWQEAGSPNIWPPPLPRPTGSIRITG